jgi:hypothetical protein
MARLGHPSRHPARPRSQQPLPMRRQGRCWFPDWCFTLRTQEGFHNLPLPQRALARPSRHQPPPYWPVKAPWSCRPCPCCRLYSASHRRTHHHRLGHYHNRHLQAIQTRAGVSNGAMAALVRLLYRRLCPLPHQMPPTKSSMNGHQSLARGSTCSIQAWRCRYAGCELAKIRSVIE